MGSTKCQLYLKVLVDRFARFNKRSVCWYSPEEGVIAEFNGSYDDYRMAG